MRKPIKPNTLRAKLERHALWFASNFQEGSRLDLSWENLREASLRGAFLKDAVLDMADMRGVDLRHACLMDVSMVGTRLQGADLRGADLSGAYCSGADLSGADLRGTNLMDAALGEANIEGTGVRFRQIGSARIVATPDGAWVGCEWGTLAMWEHMTPHIASVLDDTYAVEEFLHRREELLGMMKQAREAGWPKGDSDDQTTK